MDEGILIEIAQRFRKMEDITERIDLFVSAQKARQRYVKEQDEIQEVQDDFEKAMEACREDMVAIMQEEIRRHRA